MNNTASKKYHDTTEEVGNLKKKFSQILHVVKGILYMICTVKHPLLGTECVLLRDCVTRFSTLFYLAKNFTWDPNEIQQRFNLIYFNKSGSHGTGWISRQKNRPILFSGLEIKRICIIISYIFRDCMKLMFRNCIFKSSIKLQISVTLHV